MAIAWNKRKQHAKRKWKYTIEVLIRSITQLPNLIPTQIEPTINTSFIIQCILLFVSTLMSKFLIWKSICYGRDFFYLVRWNDCNRNERDLYSSVIWEKYIEYLTISRIVLRIISSCFYLFSRFLFVGWCSVAVKFRLKWQTNESHGERNVLNRPNWLLITLVARMLHLNHMKCMHF